MNKNQENNDTGLSIASDDETTQETVTATDENLKQTQLDNEDLADKDLADKDDDPDFEDESAELVSDEGTEEVGSFETLNLEPTVLDAIRQMGWTAPTPVQSKCLPYTIPGRDVAGFAQTGTGKTGVFLISIANEISKLKKGEIKSRDPLAIILVPTRELAVQIHSDAEELFKATNIRSMAVYGGVDYDKQAKAIKDGVDVIVATPGRLKDYRQKKILSLQHCLQFVCDEADRMFDMGFIEDVEFFLRHLGEETQKLLFSATTNDQVKELAFEYLEDPKYISVNPEVMTPERIDQKAIVCESTEKLQVLLGLIREHQPKCSIIFTNTKLVAEWVHYKLVNNGIEADLITGDLPQRKRINLIERIKEGKVKALIATDVASRGLHISDITHVYNFDLPGEAANYVHRIGRTARAGAQGSAYSLICEDYGHNLEAIREYLGSQIDIKVTMADEEHLAIEDKALNPYKDPEFKGTTSVTKAGSGDRNKDRKGGNKRGGKPDNRKGASSAKGRDGQDRSRKKHSRGKGRSDEQDTRKKKSTHQGNKGRKRPQDRHDNRKDGKKGNQQRNRQRVKEKTREPQVAAKQNQSLGGVVKKFLKLVFGRKK
ncbi:DEAD/DEAH box helicase [Pseudobacteriovorax antillogorgiicola]|uniref:ATP-dependent RNA helicase RhlB n=1 Tax=Pseudobacteriovorax antillogorgiicola TaxID=1513793 RepID=A0A1Y6C543_9BACT|nr:DEAD/DEAH box helicase [Pseudobacteriovorax antillogorgiicola]TCS49470.1 ATP-dependent RNA helicase RhlB [Pseudobacteriovorax antillogorgiicola]SMF46258.1 ATP-dependent RNA helicase RhlB [Pseudobacteriovorax antillogorgiicola]